MIRHPVVVKSDLASSSSMHGKGDAIQSSDKLPRSREQNFAMYSTCARRYELPVLTIIFHPSPDMFAKLTETEI